MNNHIIGKPAGVFRIGKRQMFIDMIQKGRLKPDWGSDGLFRIRGGLMLMVLSGKFVKN